MFGLAARMMDGTASLKIVCISISLSSFAMVIGVMRDEARVNSSLLTAAVTPARERRSLVYTIAPLLQLNFAITIPFSLKSRPLQLSWGYQLNYKLPTNATEFYGGTIRERRDASMSTSFLELEDILREHGFRGKECLLRSICELAEFPLDWGDHGVLEELLHALLTPSLGVVSHERFLHRPYKREVFEEARLLQAEQQGLSGGDCVLSYPDCEQSPLELVTQKITWA